MQEKNPFSYLRPSESAELLRTGTVEFFPAGESLFRAGDPTVGIYCLYEGAVKVSQLHQQRNITVRFASAGDWVGHRSIFTRSTYLGSATAREPTRALFVSAKVLLGFFGANPDFARQLVQQISAELEATEKKFLEYRQLNVASRLIALFRVLDEKFGSSSSAGRVMNLRLSKVEISEMIGASQEVVVRQLSKWKSEKLLGEKGKRYVLSERLLGRILRTQDSYLAKLT